MINPDELARLRRVKKLAKRISSDPNNNACACLGSAIAMLIEEDGAVRTVGHLRVLSDTIERDAVFPAYGGMRQ